jgi:hypothetical protein
VASGGCALSVCSNLTTWVPVTLGGWSFTFSATSQSALSVGYGAPADSHSVASSEINISLFRADGTTPVLVADQTPEPAAPLLTALGLLMVFGLARSR